MMIENRVLFIAILLIGILATNRCAIQEDSTGGDIAINWMTNVRE